MQGTLAGRSILIVEDEPLIALDIANAFEELGATTITARSLVDALRLVEHDGLSAAVLDFGLGDGDAVDVFQRLDQRGIPFVLHSGYGHLGEANSSGIVIPKPADPHTLIDALVNELEARRQ